MIIIYTALFFWDSMTKGLRKFDFVRRILWVAVEPFYSLTALANSKAFNQFTKFIHPGFSEGGQL